MERREALRRTSILLGGALSAPVIAGILKGCAPAGEQINWKPSFFTEAEAKAVSVISDIFIPKTDTPGAKEIGIPEFIDKMAMDTYDDDYKSRLRKGLTDFLEDVLAKHELTFDQLKPEQRVELISKLNTDAVNSMTVPEEMPFILLIKELTLIGFCTSEVGATQVLNFDEVPGVYNGCIPLDQAGGRRWAT